MLEPGSLSHPRRRHPRAGHWRPAVADPQAGGWEVGRKRIHQVRPRGKAVSLALAGRSDIGGSGRCRDILRSKGGIEIRAEDPRGGVMTGTTTIAEQQRLGLHSAELLRQRRSSTGAGLPDPQPSTSSIPLPSSCWVECRHWVRRRLSTRWPPRSGRLTPGGEYRPESAAPSCNAGSN